MGGVHSEFCIGVPRCHVEGEIKQNLVVLVWQDTFDDRDPTLEGERLCFRNQIQRKQR